MSAAIHAWVTVPRQSAIRHLFVIPDCLCRVNSAADCTTFYYTLEDDDQRTYLRKLIAKAEGKGFELESRIYDD